MRGFVVDQVAIDFYLVLTAPTKRFNRAGKVIKTVNALRVIFDNAGSSPGLVVHVSRQTGNAGNVAAVVATESLGKSAPLRFNSGSRRSVTVHRFGL